MDERDICVWGSSVCRGYLATLIAKVRQGWEVRWEVCPFHRTLDGDAVRHPIMRDPDGYFPTCLAFLPEEALKLLLPGSTIERLKWR